MDAPSALAGTTQISVHCSQCNCTITKWVSQVKNVGSEITSFKDKLLALQLSYDRLDASLNDSTTVNAARAADEYAGGYLWSQVSTALRDCQNTILGLRQALQNIEYVSRRISSILKHFAEALTAGELVLTENAISLLDRNISFPVAMINITLALQQPNLHEAAQKGALRDLKALKSDHDEFSKRLQKLSYSSQSAEHKIFQHMHTFASTVNIFMNNAAASLSQASAASVRPTAVPIHRKDVVQSPEQEQWPVEGASVTHTAEVHERLDEAIATSGRCPSTPVQEVDSNDHENGSDSDNEIELELTMEYMANGQADLEIEDFARAEENFRRALEMSEENEFSKRIEHGPGDITLMLAECLMQQEKVEEALELLEPVADGTAAFIRNDNILPKSGTTKEGFQLEASHRLAVVFLKRLDFQAAEKRAKEAFKGRRRLLGAQHSMTLESVQLIIDIYTAKDDKINARAYRRFLEPTAKGMHSGGSASSQAAAAPHTAAVNQTSNTHRTYIPALMSVASTESSTTSENSLPTRSATVRAAPPVAPALAHIAEHETMLAAHSPMETKTPVSPLASPPPTIEPDPLPPISTSSRKKMSWSNPFTRSNANKAESNVLRKPDKDSQGTTTEDASRNSSVTGINLLEQKRQMSLAGNFVFDARSLYSKASDYGDEKERCPSIASRSYSVSTHPPARTRQELVPRFSAIKTLRQEGKKTAAIDSAMKLLKEYDPDRKVLMVREAEMKKNMKESHKGMAGTGYGYAPIHFFCERRIEANIEVELLIEQGVDVNAVACKAGLPGTDPFTPLQRAVELGHAEIVRLLVEADVAITPPKPQKGPLKSGSKDQVIQPLLLACAKGHTEITFVLLAAGAGKLLKEFPQRQWHGNSLLHEACWHAATDMVKMLLDYSKNLKEQHRQSTSGQPDYESGIIGSPGQQDQFGATPIMYAIDLRDCTSERMRALKTAKRKDCLKLLLEHAVQGDLHVGTHRDSVARMLSLKWTKGPGAGHSIFCYTDEAADGELTKLLDPFRYQVSPGMRCSATPQCSATLRSSVLSSGSTSTHSHTHSGGGEGPGGTVRLPSFPELMSTPVEFRRDSTVVHEAPPPSFESAVGSMSPISPTFGHERVMSMDLTSATGSVVGSDRGTNCT